MRIAVVTEEFAPGFGAVREQVHHFAREARRLGHVVKIVTGDAGGAPRPGPGEDDVIRVGPSRAVLRGGVVTRATGGTGAGAALREVLARERFDVVHVHSPLTPVLPLLALHHATGPVVGTFHAHAGPGLVLRLAHRMAQRYLDRLDAAVAASRACLGRLEGRLREVRVIQGGVDAERFARGRRLPRLDDGKLNVLWIGRVEKRNGLGLMMAAFHRAWRQIDARLLVVGDGPGLARVRAGLPSDLADDVVFAGRVDDERPDWYASADVVCATAQSPSAGTTILEAMAAGKPVLASDVPGYRDLLQHGREGELVAAADEGAWARALVRLSREPVRAAAYGERGRMTAQRHAWPIVARELLGVFRSVGALG